MIVVIHDEAKGFKMYLFTREVGSDNATRRIVETMGIDEYQHGNREGA